MVLVSTVGTWRMSTPPVITWARPSAALREPSVTINGGTLALAIRVPFTVPHTMPQRTERTIPTSAVLQPSPPMACIVLAATTPEKTRTDPTERAIPLVTITYV